ncbi:MAG: glycosyltransferase [Desulfovibrio sp.]|jgi:glycosyltransferase involved in cell wall biosynthesis|nr:glycosyltransferase [Desulfovibrio sp.]
MSFAVSVIVPVYNAETSLARCLDSLLAQNLKEMEIIVVDDASTDNSPVIAQRYAEEYPERVRFFAQPHNMGTGKSRNVGLGLAQGEYVGFVDADDTTAPEMFAMLRETVSRADAQVVVCGMKLTSGKSGQYVILPNGITCARELLNCSKLLSPPWNKIFLRQFIIENDIRFPESRISEDMVFSFKAMACQPKLACVNRALYNYMKHPGCVTLDMAKRRDSISSIKDLSKWLRQKRRYGEYGKEYRRMLFLHLFYYPACLVLIDEMIKGERRWDTLRETPRYLYELCKFLFLPQGDA